jgi:hypothetical protein
MHKLLTKWLEQRGISSPEELDNTPMPDGSPTERQVFEEYRGALSKKELTIADLKLFCQGQIAVIENKWSTPEYLHKAELIPYHTVYKAIINTIAGDQSARESMERQLEQLTK